MVANKELVYMSGNKIFRLRCKNGSLTLGRATAVMGVLNVTPDSFSDGGLYYKNLNASVKRAKQMLMDGADIIDIGGESTRPGSAPVAVEEEIKRVVPVIKGIRRSLGSGFLISIDTYKSEVAEKALLSGADIVNSLSGFSFDKGLVNVVRRFKCPIIIYHIKGMPRTMQSGPIIYKDVVADIRRFFMSQVKIATDNGVSKHQLMIDPGIGFGKTLEQNMELVRRIGEFSSMQLPIVVGLSRKSHLGQLLKNALDMKEAPGPLDRIEASLAETAIAVLHGAHMIRTHDVLETKRFTAALDELIGRGS
jgi:dihydropteroate synthase